MYSLLGFPVISNCIDMDKGAIERVNEIKMLPMYFVTMISADVLTSVEVSDRNEKDLSETLEEMTKTDLPDEEKSKWIEMGRRGLKIIRRDREDLRKAGRLTEPPEPGDTDASAGHERRRIE